MTLEKYFDRLAKCLMSFQAIEEALRLYIEGADLEIQKKMKGFLHYEVAGKELWKMPLGPLIKEFDKRTDKKDVVTLLKRIVEKRNLFAHRGFLLRTDRNDWEEDVSKLYRSLGTKQKMADACFKVVVREGSRIRGEEISEDILNQL